MRGVLAQSLTVLVAKPHFLLHARNEHLTELESVTLAIAEVLLR